VKKREKEVIIPTVVCIILLVVSIGANLWLWTSLNQANSEITSLETMEYIKSSEIENLNREVNRLGSEKEALEAQTSDLEATINTKTSEIETLKSQVTGLQADKDNLQSQVSSLGTDKSQLESQVSSLQTDKSSLQTQVDSLNAQVESLNSQVTSLTSQITSADAQIIALQSEIDSLKDQIHVLSTPKATLAVVSWTAISNTEQPVGMSDSIRHEAKVEGSIMNPNEFTAYNVTISLKFDITVWMMIYPQPLDGNGTIFVGTMAGNETIQINETFTFAVTWRSMSLNNFSYYVNWDESG